MEIGRRQRRHMLLWCQNCSAKLQVLLVVPWVLLWWFCGLLYRVGAADWAAEGGDPSFRCGAVVLGAAIGSLVSHRRCEVSPMSRQPRGSILQGGCVLLGGPPLHSKKVI